MGKTKKNAQQAPETKEVTTKLLCMDASVTTNGKAIELGQTIDAHVTYVNEDNLRIVQHKSRSARQEAHTEHRDLQWHPLAGSLHGKVSANANGSMLILYARHDDYQTDARLLADLIVTEAEQIADALADINLAEEVAKCGK